VRTTASSVDLEYWNLRVFCEVAEQRSVTAAARRLHMTQPGVSMAIRRLEEHHHLPLIARSGNHLVLTEAGEALYRHASRTLSSARRLDLTMQALQQGSVGRITLAASYQIRAYYLPPLLLAFWRDHPDAQIQVLATAPFESPVPMLDRGVEFALLSQGAGLAGRRLVVEPLHEEPMVLVAAPDHPLARHPSLSLEEVAAQRFIVPPSEADRVGFLEERLHLGGERRLRISMMVDPSAAKYLVRGGVGLALLMRCAVEDELARGELCEISLPELKLDRHLALVYRQGHQFSPLAQEFVDFLRQHGNDRLCPRPQDEGADLHHSKVMTNPAYAG
jgi:LysR family transcriptional regulator, low CO2-responsive transcriptional regulator